MRPQKRKMNQWDYKKMTSGMKPYSKKKKPKRLDRFELSEIRNNECIKNYAESLIEM